MDQAQRSSKAPRVPAAGAVAAAPFGEDAPGFAAIATDAVDATVDAGSGRVGTEKACREVFEIMPT